MLVGPLPMLRAVRALAMEQDIPCQISLEERKACGLGVCLGCAVKTAKSPADAPEYGMYVKVDLYFKQKMLKSNLIKEIFMMNTKINFAGIEMKNPVTVASGTFGYGREFSQFFDLSKLGE